MRKTFKVGNFCFEIIYPLCIPIPDNFLKFETNDEAIDYMYYIQINEDLPYIDGIVIAERNDIIIYQTDFGEARVLGINGLNEFYACYQEKESNNAIITITKTQKNLLSIDTVFTSLFALEKRLITKNKIILHCAYIKYKDEAILFSAPSETGKTTQANLWEEYLGSQTINGDRALLGYENNKWIAHGWPVCGTSGVCNNINTPIKAIVMLSQGKEDSVEQLSPAKAFSLLYSQITINRWNNLSHIQIINLIEQLIQNVPIYHLSCTISKNAVMCLKNAIYDI